MEEENHCVCKRNERATSAEPACDRSGDAPARTTCAEPAVASRGMHPHIDICMASDGGGMPLFM